MTRSEDGGMATRRLVFERLTDGRLLKAYRLATLVLRDPVEGEDAVHDAAVLAWTRVGELRDHTRFDAWFDRIVINVCRQRLRRRRGRSVVTQIVMEGTPNLAHGDGTSARAERDALRHALDRLTPEHRMVVVLRHLEGYSTGEIAARTGEREGTVKSRLHYALRELRSAYDAVERGPEGER